MRKIREDIKEYLGILKDVFDRTGASREDGKSYPIDEAVEKAARMIIKQTAAGGKLLFIGNGGSASIASHMAADFLKNGGISALAFNDSSLLTCISNDCGYEYVFEKPIEAFAKPGDILVAISSSGKSRNILRGIKAAKKKGSSIITLSGFKESNPLKKLGDINFYIPSLSYGIVETAHLLICHCLADVIIKKR